MTSPKRFRAQQLSSGDFKRGAARLSECPWPRATADYHFVVVFAAGGENDPCRRDPQRRYSPKARGMVEDHRFRRFLKSSCVRGTLANRRIRGARKIFELTKSIRQARGRWPPDGYTSLLPHFGFYPVSSMSEVAGGCCIDRVRVKSLIHAALHSLPARLRLCGIFEWRVVTKAQGTWSKDIHAHATRVASLFEETCHCELISVRSLLLWTKTQTRPGFCGRDATNKTRHVQYAAGGRRLQE